MQDVEGIARELIPMVQRIADSRRPIPRSATLYHDLQIAGDDAAELFEAIAARFGTSFKGFDWPVYFPNETEVGLISYWAAKMGFRDKRHKPLTIAHLLAVIGRGHWFEPSP